MNKEVGYVKGECCNRNECVGIIEEHPSESQCSCHINPPCSYCTDAREFCPVCEWEGREEQLEHQYKPVVEIQSYYNLVMAREDTHRHKIDMIRQGKGKADKIEYYLESHTHFSMKKIGVFPIGTPKDVLLKEIQGSWGGRFTSFDPNKGTFNYIAYTD